VSDQIWTLDELVDFTKSDEPEVRYWAVDRLVRHFPEECCDAIAEFLLDDHDATPPTVARHLGEHGNKEHHAILVRGFRLLRGLTPGDCLQALASLGYPGVTRLASDALKRGDLTEPALAIIVDALARLGTSDANDLVREYAERRVEILAEPPALRGVLSVVRADEIPSVLAKFVKAVERRGAQRGGEAFRTVMDALGVDDAAWCFRTGPSGHLELRKTIKAVESGYDCDIFSTMGESTIKQIAQRFRAGNRDDIVRALAEWTCRAAGRMTAEEDDDRPQRIAAAVGAFASPSVLQDIRRLGRQFEQWLLGFQLSTAFAVARAQASPMSLREARGDLEKLLQLAELETAFHLSELPRAIAVVCREDEARARRAQEWCLRMLEARGPFFPKIVALETLGELRAVHFIPEIMEYLSEENSYIYSTAERALSKFGEAIVEPAVAKIEQAVIDPDAAHSLLVLLCDLGTHASYSAVARHLDWFMDTVGPGTTAEWVCLFGVDDLIEPLRDWLEEDPPLVGQSLLLLGALHHVEIPEEDEILRAIEDERARQAESKEGEGGPSGAPPTGGDYLM
jgi:hypothetical protein